ncbi:MAG: hypothetical protein ACIAXF_01025, partial [Phycisphaerales bacterium JB063]
MTHTNRTPHLHACEPPNPAASHETGRSHNAALGSHNATTAPHNAAIGSQNENAALHNEAWDAHNVTTAPHNENTTLHNAALALHNENTALHNAARRAHNGNSALHNKSTAQCRENKAPVGENNTFKAPKTSKRLKPPASGARITNTRRVAGQSLRCPGVYLMQSYSVRPFPGHPKAAAPATHCL